jgi:CxxC motif-containing protein
MTRTRKPFLIALSIVSVAFAVPTPAHAQPGYYAEKITCSSNNGKRNWCNIGNSRDVRLVRQISGSPCVRGSTWGIDQRGLWVDSGCRAEFAIGRSPGPPPSQTINCSSNNGKRNWCAIGNSRDVQLVRQISGSPCVRGSTWGIDQRGLWVDNGCRADFAIGRGGPGPPAYAPPQLVTCSSNNGKRNWCNIGNSRDVQLVRQISGSPCVRGSTWGIDQRGLWVDNGCRADFRVR